MATTTEIIYREFWDVPRIFIARFRGKQYLFDCSFDESLDEYPDSYEVYVLPNLDDGELKGSWIGVSARAEKHLGAVLVKNVVFDESKRCAIDPLVIDELANRE